MTCTKWRINPPNRRYNHPRGYRARTLEILLGKIDLKTEFKGSGFTTEIDADSDIKKLVKYLITERGRSGIKRKELKSFREMEPKEILEYFLPKMVTTKFDLEEEIDVN